MKFTTFICYELADIIHRSFFKLKIDLLACCVNNKDVNYYNHMLLSTARDLSCYVAQVNVAQYGGSGLIQPAKTILASIMNIKGGKNATILVDDLNIQEIQKHHARRAGYPHPIFKPIPPTNDN